MAGLSIYLLGSVTMLIAFLLIITVPEVSKDAVVQDKGSDPVAAEGADEKMERESYTLCRPTAAAIERLMEQRGNLEEPQARLKAKSYYVLALTLVWALIYQYQHHQYVLEPIKKEFACRIR
jgi:competence protein ComGC